MRPINLVALVDDDEIANFIGQKVIESTRLAKQIKVFASSLEVLNFLKANSSDPELLPEIILLDLNMPIMDGFEFLSEYVMLKQFIEKKIHIYIVSSSLSTIDHHRIKIISETPDFIIKPLTKQKFERIVEAFVERSVLN